MTQTVVDKLMAQLKLAPKDGEDAQVFAKRLALKANNIADEGWEALGQEGQLWVNAALDAVEKKKPVPLPAGLAATPVVPKPKKVAPPKEPKAPKPKKQLAPGEPSGLGPKGKFSRTDKIKVVPKENPFREGTKCNTWFASIKNGMTVEQAIEAGAPRNHIRWAHTLGHLEIGT